MDSIQKRGFSFEILYKGYPLEKTIYRNYNYYGIKEGSSFALRLGNSHPVRVDVDVLIDGKKVGTWRIHPKSRIEASHPRFYTYRNNVLIKVIFKPETQTYYKTGSLGSKGYHDSWDPTVVKYECQNFSDTVSPENMHRHCAHKAHKYEEKIFAEYLNQKKVHGITDQRFQKTLPLINLDPRNFVVVATRVVVLDDDGRYIKNTNFFRNAQNTGVYPPYLELRHPLRPHSCEVDSKFKLSEKYWFDNL